MNKLTLGIGKEIESDKQILLLSIDETEFRKIICDKSSSAFFEELFDSLEQTGDYLIFTCSCGIADCSGWSKVKVIHLDDKISWSFNYDNYNYKYIFLKSNYVSEIQKIQELLTENNIRLHPEFIVYPE